MAIYAPKIFTDIELELMHQVLDISKNNGLEVALYGYKEYPDDIKERIKKIDTNKKSVHLWQKHVALKGLLEESPNCIASYKYERDKCKELGIKKAIIHNNFSATVEYIEDPETYANKTIKIFEDSYKNNLVLHLENIFKPFEWFERFYLEIDKLNALDVIGFCLDTGHARAFNGVTSQEMVHEPIIKACPFRSKATLDNWLNFIEYISSRGSSIHYHIHANDGTGDQHQTLNEANKLGLLEPSEDWAPSGYIAWLKKASFTTPTAIFCLEHPAGKAKEAMNYIDSLKSNNDIY